MEAGPMLMSVAKLLQIEGYPLGVGGGGAQILVSAWRFVSSDQQGQIAEWIHSQRDEIETAPLQKFDPIGYAIVDNAILNKAAVYGRIRASRNREETVSFLTGAEWNPVYCNTLHDTLELLFATANLNGLIRPPVRNPREVPSGVIARMRHQHRHFWAPDYVALAEEDSSGEDADLLIPGTFEWFRARALAALRAFKPSAVASIPKNWASPVVGRRTGKKQTVGSQFRNLREVPRCIRMRTLVDIAQRCTVDDEIVERLDDTDGLGPSINPKTPTATWAPTVLSCLAPPRGLGRAAFSSVLRTACSTLHEPGSAVVALTAASGIPVQQLSFANFDFYPAGCMLSLPVINPVGASGSESDFELTEPSGDIFLTAIPRRLGIEIKRFLGEYPAAVLEAKANDFLASFPFCPSTYAMLLTVVRQCVPVWHNVPAIQFQIAADPNAKVVQPWRHYQHWSLAHFATPIRKYLRGLFDPTFELPKLDTFPGCGSPFILRLSVVRDLISELRHLLDEEPPSSTESLIQRFNFVGACTRHIESLLTFTRGQNDFAPMEVRGNGRTSPLTAVETSRIIVEKGLKRKILFPPQLTTLAERVALWQRLQSERIEHSGRKIIRMPETLHLAYGILSQTTSVAGTRQLQLERPSRRNVILALSSHLDGKFAMLNPRWPRHFANFRLRTAGFPEIDVLAAMDHFLDRRTGSIAPDAIHIGLSEQTIFTMAEYLARTIGLTE